MFGDGFLHLMEINAEALALDDELLELAFKEIGLFSFADGRALGDNRDRAGTNFEEACIDETGDYLVGGVGIDFELSTESADGREFVARTELARDDGLGGGVNNLLIDGCSGPEVHIKRNHVVYYSR
jgi:hypothetical protein